MERKCVGGCKNGVLRRLLVKCAGLFEKRRHGLALVQRMLGAEDALSPEGARRLQRIQALFEPRPLLAASSGTGPERGGGGRAVG